MHGGPGELIGGWLAGCGAYQDAGDRCLVDLGGVDDGVHEEPPTRAKEEPRDAWPVLGRLMGRGGRGQGAREGVNKQRRTVVASRPADKQQQRVDRPDAVVEPLHAHCTLAVA